jgi:hypothetical protein
MTSNIVLFIFIMSILASVVYSLIYDDTSEEELDEMLNSKDMFP